MRAPINPDSTVSGRKLGCFLSTTLAMLGSEHKWMNNPYGGLIDVSLEDLGRGAAYSTLTEMYFEYVLDAPSHNAWWRKEDLTEPNSLIRKCHSDGPVPVSVPLEAIKYRTDLFPESLSMGNRMHVFILSPVGDDQAQIIDPRVGSIHTSFSALIDQLNAGDFIKLPCIAYLLDWKAIRERFAVLGPALVNQRKLNYARHVLSKFRIIHAEKVSRLWSAVSNGDYASALTENLFHPVMTARQIALEDSTVWRPDRRKVMFECLNRSSLALYALHLKMARSVLSARGCPTTIRQDLEDSVRELTRREEELILCLSDAIIH